MWRGAEGAPVDGQLGREVGVGGEQIQEVLKNVSQHLYKSCFI